MMRYDRVGLSSSIHLHETGEFIRLEWGAVWSTLPDVVALEHGGLGVGSGLGGGRVGIGGGRVARGVHLVVDLAD